VSGDGYRDAPFALPTNGTLVSTGTDLATVVELGTVDRPGRSPENVVALLRIPRRRGMFAWTNQVAQPLDSGNIFATIVIAGKSYVSIEGSTTVAFYRDVATNLVSGTFEGTLGSAFGDTIVVSGGRFEVEVDQP
jgi:hypothetical protein